MNTTAITFGALGVPHPIVEALGRDGKTTAFPIQVDTLPDTLAGRDVLGRGRTGSGKTLAFGIPMVARLGTRLSGGRARSGRPLGLVLAPTRELATQIEAVLAPLARAYGLTTTTVFGGVSQNRQVSAFRAGVDIVVACPGRLEDLMKQGHVQLDAVEITVLDEADHMADLGFLPAVTRILAATPADGQRMLFSATLDNGVNKLVARFLHNAVSHQVGEADTPIAAMTHHVLATNDAGTKTALVNALAGGKGRRILFLRTKQRAKRLARQLIEAGIPAVDLHGNLSQPQRDRNLAAFMAGTVRVLVATDIAARGVHVDDVELVVHVDPPVESKAYLHRSGRTARAGNEGDVVTIVLPEQEKDVAAIMRKAGIQAPTQRVNATSDAVRELVGATAPLSSRPVSSPPQSSRPQSSRTRSSRPQSSSTQSSGTQSSRPQSSGTGAKAAAPAARQPARGGVARASGERSTTGNSRRRRPRRGSGNGMRSGTQRIA